MRIFVIAGTPGTGKTTVCEQISSKLRADGKSVTVLNLSEWIKEKKLFDEYDPHFDTYLIDEKKIRRAVESFIKEVSSSILIIESHTVDCIPKAAVDFVLVLSSRTDVLYDRLVARGYQKAKLDENMECEIMSVVLEEAVHRFGPKKVRQCPSNEMDDLEEILEIFMQEFNKI